MTIIDVHTRATRKCVEPNCESFEIGHEEFVCFANEATIIHSRGENYGVTVEKAEAAELWDIAVDFTGDLTIDEASRLVAVLVEAIADASALNGAMNA